MADDAAAAQKMADDAAAAAAQKMADDFIKVRPSLPYCFLFILSIIISLT